MCKRVCAHSHHEQHGWDDQAGVGCVAKKRSHEGRQIQVNGLHDHVKHLLLPAARSHTQPHISRLAGTDGILQTMAALLILEIYHLEICFPGLQALLVAD